MHSWGGGQIRNGIKLYLIVLLIRLKTYEKVQLALLDYYQMVTTRLPTRLRNEWMYGNMLTNKWSWPLNVVGHLEQYWKVASEVKHAQYPGHSDT